MAGCRLITYEIKQTDCIGSRSVFLTFLDKREGQCYNLGVLDGVAPRRMKKEFGEKAETSPSP